MTKKLERENLIVKVLTDAGEPLSHKEIAKRISALDLPQYRGPGLAGTVNSAISTSMSGSPTKTPFSRPQRGLITLRSCPRKPTDDSDIVNGLISSYGIRWEKSAVHWKSNPRLLGTGARFPEPVNFCKQKGVYLLYDSREVIYAGSSARDNLGNRLRSHTTERLATKWDTFSWFGLYPIQPNGVLKTDSNLGGLGLEALVRGLEALLIEAILPRRNRRGGDNLRGVEFNQVRS